MSLRLDCTERALPVEPVDGEGLTPSKSREPRAELRCVQRPGGSFRFVHLARRAADAVGRADRARRERPSRLELRPRRAAGSDALSSPPESSPLAPGGLPSHRSTASAAGRPPLLTPVRNLRGRCGPDVFRVARVLVLVFASAVLGVLAPGAPARADASVSNLSFADSGTYLLTDSSEFAMGFVTGDYPDGYSLTSVTLDFGSNDAAGVFDLLLWPASSDGSQPEKAANSQIVQFADTSNLPNFDIKTFSPQANTTLTPDCVGLSATQTVFGAL